MIKAAMQPRSRARRQFDYGMSFLPVLLLVVMTILLGWGISYLAASPESIDQNLLLGRVFVFRYMWLTMLALAVFGVLWLFWYTGWRIRLHIYGVLQFDLDGNEASPNVHLCNVHRLLREAEKRRGEVKYTPIPRE